GLERLSQLARAYPGIKFEFEVEIKTQGKTGFIDCLGTLNDVLFLLDFKRSKGSNPSFAAWEEDYPKIQLWFYLAALKSQGILTEQTKLGVGYLFFKDLSDSWLACDGELVPAIEAQVEKWAKAWDDKTAAL